MLEFLNNGFEPFNLFFELFLLALLYQRQLELSQLSFFVAGSVNGLMQGHGSLVEE